MLTIEAPAKINLTLDIKGKRLDGYHELETVMHQINLMDKIHLQLNDEGIRVKSNSRLIPDDHDNLAFKAAQLLFTKFGIKAGIDIFIEKNIPVGAGLAGGSTDAAAVLQGINRLLELNIDITNLLDLGAAIGSDVPFCLLGGTALAKGRGEILTSLEHRQLEMVLIKPDFALSTAEIYGMFKMDQVKSRPDNASFLRVWHSYDIMGIAREINNVLESVSVLQHPQIEFIKKKLCYMGAINALMSGSGPSVFGIFKSQREALQAWEALKDQELESYLVSSFNK